MPDISSAPAIGPPTGLYPQPPSQQGALSDPTRMIDLMGAIARNTMLQNELRARTAVGQAYQGALTPEGVDIPRLRAGLASDPAASWMLPEAMQHVQTLAGTQFETLAKQDQAIRDVLGTLPENASKEDVFSRMVQLSRLGVPPALIVGWAGSYPNNPKAVREWVANVRNSAIGSAGISGRVAGPPGPGGEPTSISLGQANVGAGPQGMPVGLPPGGEQSALEMRADLSRAGQFGQEMFPWQEALRASGELRAKYGEGFFGPGSKGRQDFKSFFYALAPTVSRWAGVDPKALEDYAKADKYLTQAVQTRAQGFGAHTDQQLATTISGSPNVHVNDLAVDDVIKASIALRRAEHAQVMQSSKAGGPNYTGQKAQWPAQNDIRAFSLDLLTPDQRNKLVSSLTPAERRKFNSSLRTAYETGVMDRPSVPAAAPPPAPARTAATPPAAARMPPKPSVPGVALGRRADGSQGWFVPDPNRPGKHLEVILPGLGQ